MLYIYKFNPLDQARAPRGHIWRKETEGLACGCTAKGSHCGSGERVAKFVVAITYREGVVLWGAILGAVNCLVVFHNLSFLLLIPL